MTSFTCEEEPELTKTRTFRGGTAGDSAVKSSICRRYPNNFSGASDRIAFQHPIARGPNLREHSGEVVGYSGMYGSRWV